MACWNIGIDESGNFEYYSSKGKKSFVCAVITTELTASLDEKFSNLFYMMNGRGERGTEELLNYFHAMNRTDDEKSTIFGNLKNDIYKVVVSKGRPLVLCNPQHWWLSGVMSVLRQIILLDEINTGDSVNIVLGTRWLNVVGLPVNGNVSLDWYDYHKNLQQELLRWIKSIDKKVLNIRLYCEQAAKSVLVTLADQAGGMVNKNRSAFLGDKVCYAECVDYYEMSSMEPSKSVTPNLIAEEKTPLGNPNENTCKRFLEESNYLTALQLWLRAFFAKENIPFKLFSDIMNGAFTDGHTYTEAWRIVLDTCEYALDNRGEDPQLIGRVFKLEPELQNEYARIQKLNGAQKSEYGIDVQLLMDIWRVLAKVSSHRGDATCNVLDYIECFWKTGGQEIGRTMDRWKFYLQTKLIDVQILFNGYDFSSVTDRFEPMLDCHEKLCDLPFPFENAAGDDDLAALLGTCGQAAAFQGNLDEAINCFEEDYANSSADWKSMPASFMVTVLHRMCDFERACEWFEKQTDGVSFEDFGKNLSSTSDLWQMVNYFKILVLAQLQERPVECNIPELESWNIQNTYPWPLVLKWAALSYLQGENVDRGVVLLEEAKKLLKKGGFAIKTLALPILQMLYCVTEEEKYEKEYEGLLQQLVDACETFKVYVEAHGDAFKLDKDKDLWEAAMILPFNYA
ncbi:hypothetical protein [Fibrobacter sp.]|uniref:hypothetical protein n=1 Tax=Fibrobacter sp. TaxID=35828 RepID=UPI0025C54B66|nr:hypothetical protein [Fibrobacter sp.]MBS7273263.1 hypothetical protein [Fibrobacter sp.]